MSSESAAYVLVKSRKWRIHKRLHLPLSLGSSPDNSIIVNSKAVSPSIGVIACRDGELLGLSSDGATFDFKQFGSAYGFNFRGPFPKSLLQRGSFFRGIGEVLVREGQGFEKVSLPLKRALGGFFPQWLRLAVWGFCGFSMVAFLAAYALNFHAQEEDRSRELIAIPYAGFYNKTIGSNSTYRGFRSGFSLQVMVPEQMRAQDHVLTFLLKDNDRADELSVEVNGLRLYSSVLDNSCLNAFCPVQVAIPSSMLNSGKLVLFFRHNFPDSDFVVRQIAFEAVRPLNPEELKTIERWLSAGKRYYDERFIAHENILKSRGEVLKVLDVLRTKSGAGEYRAAAESLLSEANANIVTKVNDLWFLAQQNVNLGRYEEARKSLLAMKLFVVSSEDPRFSTMNRLLKTTEDFLK